jgi:hypothetical protein
LGSDEIGYLCGPHSAEGVSFADAWIHGGDGSAGATLSRVNDYARRSGVPSRRIDDILTGGAPLHTEVAFRAPVGEVWASDHFGLVSDVSTKA